MPRELLWLLVAGGLLYAVFGFIVARKSFRWNRGRGRGTGTAAAMAVAAGLGWPLTIRFWEADWLVTGRRSWRGDR